jgi:hypothetical protein
MDRFKTKLRLFKHRIVFRSKEFGNDIIPSLQALYYMKPYNIQFVYKFHTKTDKTIFNENVDFLLNKSTQELKHMLLNHSSNCVGYSYKDIDRETIHCIKLLNTYQPYFDKKEYVLYTFFFTNMCVIDKIIDFIKDNHYLGYFMNNLYDTNTILMDNSPVHFLERLFGIIK